METALTDTLEWGSEMFLDYIFHFEHKDVVDNIPD